MSSFERNGKPTGASSTPVREHRHPVAKATEWLLGVVGFEQVSALLRGYSLGYDAGLREARLRAKIEVAQKTNAASAAPSSTLFSDTRLEITAQMEALIKADVASRIPKEEQPSEDQWKLILSRTPTTSVIAGAGSGKSTTMVLRLVVLRHYLGIQFSSITVVTFTRESKRDFAEKLRKVFLLWGHDVSVKQSERIVRTFHSRILSFARCLPGLTGVQPFEFLKDRVETDNKHQELAVEELSASESHEAGVPVIRDNWGGEDDLDEDLEEPDTPVIQLKLNLRQIGLLRQVYSDLYRENSVFKKLILNLYIRSISLRPLDSTALEVAAQLAKSGRQAYFDDALCVKMAELWSAAGKWPIDGIDPAGKLIQLGGQKLRADGYIEALDAYVLLGLDESEPKDLAIENRKSWLQQDLAKKQLLFQVHSTRPVLLLNSYHEASKSIEELKGSMTSCPVFDYKVKGELSASHILEAFYSAASFIENLGLDVEHAVKNMQLPQRDLDKIFFEALGIFWRRFNQQLKDTSPPIMTFNTMFALFNEQNQDSFQYVPDGVLRPMTTLLIDEFQDVGANTMSWVKATFAEIGRRELQPETRGVPSHPSLIAVGDDWQSIYGWRGSSPEFFVDFDKHFTALNSTRVIMNENYRSHQWIIDAAESLVAKTALFENKSGIAANEKVTRHREPVCVFPFDPEDWKGNVKGTQNSSGRGCAIAQGNDLNKHQIEAGGLIEGPQQSANGTVLSCPPVTPEVLADLVRKHYEQGDSILILYRTRKYRKALQAATADLIARSKEEDREKDLMFLTYHASKGLQAKAVFLLGDCETKTSSPYKNDILRQARMGAQGDARPYDSAQDEEALRTAYVAVTRAITYCYWFVEVSGKGGEGRVKASKLIDAAREYWRVYRADN
ncbi:UvrD-helicase domain-containing protein [Pseudomonas sp. TUM22785]|uniref:UvrD-helicase domain-containing protein n=1 Tax=Pseudomonas sp. TUM22785 TaxID=3019098 RepID=UPI00230511B1|nr:UvrD-helicase domain-containing protein [Pseudomonas sp. TUM22785]WCD78561.1 UvrD-helicase domain-containing protein [Pseudomonas sp. TUM22785]